MNLKVLGASGATFEVLNDEEVAYWNQALHKYQEQFKFDNMADLQDLDKVLTGEILSFRWGNWLVREADYDGRSIEEIETKLKKEMDTVWKETRLLKEKMGLNRATRQDSESQSVSDYLTTLKTRAKEFGVHRDQQIAKAIDLLHELFTQTGLYLRCDEEERAHLKVNAEDIINWIEQVARPEFNIIDDAFRKNQKLWIKEVS